jgi:4-hydroxybenzoyl-CoA reductase subunit beta
MQLPEFEYLRPKSLAEGLQALAEHGDKVAIMSGGSDLLINMKFRLDTPEYLLSLNGVPELQQVEELADGGLRIGAACILTDLAQNPLISERYPALHDAVWSVGSRHVRNVGTLGGNICLDTRCWYTNQSETWRETRSGCFKTDNELCHVIKTATKCHALSSTDGGPMLMALDASVVLASADAERTVPMREFYHDDGMHHTVLKPGEVLIAVLLKPPAGRAVFAKLSQREGLDFAAGAFAAAVTGSNDKPESVSLVMGSIAPEPRVMEKSQQILMESGFTDEAIEQAAAAARSALSEVTNLFTPSGYKRRLIRALVKDALVKLRDQPERG